MGTKMEPPVRCAVDLSVSHVHASHTHAFGMKRKLLLELAVAEATGVRFFPDGDAE